MLKDKRNPNVRISGQIAIAAIALSLGIIILGLTYVISFMDIFIIIFVPFIAALVALRGDYRGQLLFFFGAIAISFISWQEGFFQFLPNAIIGLIFGNIVKKLSASFPTYLIVSLCSLIIEIVLIYPINFIFEVDMIDIYAKIFGLTKDAFKPIFPLFYLILASIQTLIMFITVSSELSKLGYIKDTKLRLNSPLFYLLIDIFVSILVIVGYFFAPWLMYLALGYILIILGYQVFRVIYPIDRINAIVLGISLIISIVIYFIIVNLLDDPVRNYLGLIPGVALFLTVTIVLMHFHSPSDSFKNNKKDILRDL